MPGVGAAERAEQLPCLVQVWDLPRGGDGEAFGGEGCLVLAEAGGDARVPVRAGEGVWEVGAFAEEGAEEGARCGGGGGGHVENRSGSCWAYASGLEGEGYEDFVRR